MNKDWSETDNFVEMSLGLKHSPMRQMSKGKRNRLKKKLAEQLVEAGVLEYDPKNKQAGKTLKKLMKRMTASERQILTEMIGEDYI